MADETGWELRATGSLNDISRLLQAEFSSQIKSLHELSPAQWASDAGSKQVECAGNQHTCNPTVLIPAMNQTFDLKFTGTGDADIVGQEDGPRPLVWKSTTLTCDHATLGKMTITLDPAKTHAGTLIPLSKGQAFPAINRNVYYFVLKSDVIGDLISEKPAIVESTIDQVPPTSQYVFKNPPLSFYRRGDPEKTPVAIILHAATDVAPQS